MDPKKYLIGGREFIIPKTTLRQYKQISTLVKEHLKNIKITSSENTEMIVNIGSLIMDLLEQNALEKLLAAIFDHSDSTIFEDIDDETLVEVLSDFFSGKAGLIGNIAGSFKSLQSDNKEQTAESNPS